MRPEVDSGVPAGAELLAYADALVGPDRTSVDHARAALSAAPEPAAVSAAAAVAGNFTKNDRIANGLGIPVDDMVLKATEDLRARLGLNDFASSVNTFRHRPG